MVLYHSKRRVVNTMSVSKEQFIAESDPPMLPHQEARFNNFTAWGPSEEELGLHTCIYDEGRTGKTKIAIDLMGWLNVSDFADNVTIITTNGDEVRWVREIEKHYSPLIRRIRCEIFDHKKPKEFYDEFNKFNGLKILIYNFGQIAHPKADNPKDKAKSEFAKKVASDFINTNKSQSMGIMDNCHKSKNDESKNGRFLPALSKALRHKVVMTSIPIVNHAGDLRVAQEFLQEGFWDDMALQNLIYDKPKSIKPGLQTSREIEKYFHKPGIDDDGEYYDKYDILRWHIPMLVDRTMKSDIPWMVDAHYNTIYVDTCSAQDTMARMFDGAWKRHEAEKKEIPDKIIEIEENQFYSDELKEKLVDELKEKLGIRLANYKQVLQQITHCVIPEMRVLTPLEDYGLPVETWDVLDHCVNPRLQELSRYIYETDERCIIFYNFRQDVDKILSLFKHKGIDVACVTAKQKPSAKISEMERFNSGEVDWILIGLRYGDAGCELTDVNRAVFYGSTYWQANMVGCQDIIHNMNTNGDVCFDTISVRTGKISNEVGIVTPDDDIMNAYSEKEANLCRITQKPYVQKFEIVKLEKKDADWRDCK